MSNKYNVLLSVVTCFLLFNSIITEGNSTGKTIPVFDQQHASLEDWKHKSFNGDTRYDVTRVEGRIVIRANSNKSASALYRELPVDLRKTPYLNWKWRVENILPVDDPMHKSGDDYPARVYVVIRYGVFPWQVHALNYVWANRVTEKAYWRNPYTDKAVMVPLESGPANTGTWRSERINVMQDYQRIFLEDAETIEGVAIMTDTDDSSSHAVAYYDDIYFSD